MEANVSIRHQTSVGALVAAALIASGLLSLPSAPFDPDLRTGTPAFEHLMVELAETVMCATCWWLALATVLTLAGALRGDGSVTARAARRITPHLWRRLLGVALGGTLALASPAAATAASPDGASDEPRITGLRLPDRPSGAVPRPDSAPRGVVVVRAGDTLWDIAASHLPAGTDDATRSAACRRWYTANRAVIGPDPDLLLPGTRLHVPADRAERTSR